MENNNIITNGSILKGLIKLTVPMLASAILQNVQTLIDLFWVGRLGSTSVAALAMSGTIFMLVFPLIMGASIGTVALISRSVGAGNNKEASDIAVHSIILAILMGIITGLSGFIFADKVCPLLGGVPEVVAQGTAYLRISLLGSFTLFLLFIGNSILRGAGNTVIPMCAMVFANLLNIVLDPILIFGWGLFPAMGVRGAALATVLAQLIAAVMVVGALIKGTAGISLKPVVAFNSSSILRILRIGIPGIGQMLSRSLMALVLMRIVAASGTAAIAAYGIVLRFHMILLMPAFAIANAAATMVGQNMGASRPDRAAESAWFAAGIDGGFMVVASIIVMILAPDMISVFNQNVEVIAVGTNYLRTVAPFFIFMAMGIVLGRSLHGAGDTIPPMVCTVFSLWGLQVPLAFLLSRYCFPATQGIWWAIAIATVVHGLLLMIWFKVGRWKRKTV